MRKIFSDDRGRRHWLLNKTAAMQSETDDTRSTGSIVKQNIQTRSFNPSFVCVRGICSQMFFSVFYWPTQSSAFYVVRWLIHNHSTLQQLVDEHVVDGGSCLRWQGRSNCLHQRWWHTGTKLAAVPRHRQVRDTHSEAHTSTDTDQTEPTVRQRIVGLEVIAIFG